MEMAGKKGSDGRVPRLPSSRLFFFDVVAIVVVVVGRTAALEACCQSNAGLLTLGGSSVFVAMEDKLEGFSLEKGMEEAIYRLIEI